MYRQLCEYQRKAVDFILSHPYCGICIAPDMGKEAIGLSVVWQLLFDYFYQGKILIVVEKAFEERWKQELKNEEYEYVNCISIHGNDAEKQKQLLANGQIYFADDNAMTWIIQQEKWIFDIIILDNLSRYKNEKTKLFRGLYQNRFAINRLIGFLPERHELQELWAEWLLIDGGRSLGMYKEAFYERYFFRNRRKLEAKNDAKKAIYKRLSNSLYWVDNTEATDVPAKVYKYLYMEMEATEYSKYQWFERGNGCCFELMQLANGMWCDSAGKGYCLHIKKVNELIKICKLHQNRRILVLYWFAQDAWLVRDNIKDAVILKSYEDVALWRGEQIQMALVSALDKRILNVLGYSADVLIWFSLNEAKDVYNEINKTMLKVGGRTWVYHLIVKGTVDEEMARCYIG